MTVDWWNAFLGLEYALLYTMCPTAWRAHYPWFARTLGWSALTCIPLSFDWHSPWPLCLGWTMIVLGLPLRTLAACELVQLRRNLALHFSFALAVLLSLFFFAGEGQSSISGTFAKLLLARDLVNFVIGTTLLLYCTLMLANRGEQLSHLAHILLLSLLTLSTAIAELIPIGKNEGSLWHTIQATRSLFQYGVLTCWLWLFSHYVPNDGDPRSPKPPQPY